MTQKFHLEWECVAFTVIKRNVNQEECKISFTQFAFVISAKRQVAFWKQVTFSVRKIHEENNFFLRQIIKVEVHLEGKLNPKLKSYHNFLDFKEEIS